VGRYNILNKTDKSVNPYEHLVIYNFDGIFRFDATELDTNAFLGEWREEDTSFLFFSNTADDEIDQMLTDNPGVSLAGRYEMTGEQWHGEKIEPYCVDSLLVSPPWNRKRPEDKDITQVVLDPGVVFGTGRHQTTEDCLTLMQRVCKKESIKSVLDIGTGTGLLAVGAAALGCDRVLACDFNYLAVKTALNNVRLNQFENRILAFQAKGEETLVRPNDLLIANIHYDVMQHLIHADEFYKNKWLILSGVLNSETKKILNVLTDKPVRIVERRCPDGIWNTLLLKQV